MSWTRRRLLSHAARLAALPAWSLAADRVSAAEDDAVRLTTEPTSLRLRDGGPETPALRFAGADPLPILRIKPGDPMTVRLHNGLAAPTSLQWHGLRGQNGLDDPATQAFATIAAGATGIATLTPRDSGTSWFHPNPGRDDQTSRGLAGVLIVEERQPPAVDHDIVCLLADWRLDPDNRAVGAGGGGAMVLTLNNRPLPASLTAEPGARLRLRLINGSTRRMMVVACDGAKPSIVAIDGQPSELFKPVRDTVPIGPGARFDLILDMPAEPGKAVRLTVKGSERVGDAIEPDQVIATVVATGTALAARPPLAPLPANPALPAMIPLEAAKRVELGIEAGPDEGSWMVNGVGGATLPRAPVLRVRRGDAVTLGFLNKSKVLVPLRVYGQAMRLLHANDDGWEPYWRDSLLLPPGGKAHAAFVADTPGRWPIESGFNDQTVGGLRCWFEVS